MKILLILLISFFSTICLSQSITVDSVKTNYKGINYDDFFYIHPNFDSTAYRWLANITCHFDTLNNDCSIDKIFRLLETKGNKLGGNAFTVSSSDIVSKNDKHISLSIYKLRHGLSWQKKNYFLFPNNKIYLFGHLVNQNTKLTFQIQDKTFNINNFSYVEIDFPKGSNVEIDVKLNRRSSTIFNSHSSDDNKDNNLIKYIQIGGFFRRQLLYSHPEQGYSQFLIHILKKQPL